MREAWTFEFMRWYRTHIRYCTSVIGFSQNNSSLKMKDTISVCRVRSSDRKINERIIARFFNNTLQRFLSGHWSFVKTHFTVTFTLSGAQGDICYVRSLAYYASRNWIYGTYGEAGLLRICERVLRDNITNNICRKVGGPAKGAAKIDRREKC